MEIVIVPFTIFKPYADPEGYTKAKLLQAVQACVHKKAMSSLAMGCIVLSDLSIFLIIKNYFIRINQLYNQLRLAVCSSQPIQQLLANTRCALIEYFCEKTLLEVLADLFDWMKRDWDLESSLFKADMFLRITSWTQDLFNGFSKLFSELGSYAWDHLVLVLSAFFNVMAGIDRDGLYNRFCAELGATSA